MVHALYAAGLLGAALRAEPADVRLRLTNYFEPINEGAIAVGPFDAPLTPVGAAMALLAAHAGGARVLVPDALEELDVVATAK